MGESPTQRAKMRKKMRKVRGKIRTIDRNLRERIRKVEVLPTGTVKLAMTLFLIVHLQMTDRLNRTVCQEREMPFGSCIFFSFWNSIVLGVAF